MRSQLLRVPALVVIGLLFSVSSAGARYLTHHPQSISPLLSQAATSGAGKNPATLNQLMRGLMFYNANVIFASQSKKFLVIPDAPDPAAATDPVTGTYGHWEAVENSSLALVEAANLLEVPGRRCSNGRPVPTGNRDWLKLVQGLRDAGMQSYEAAKSRDRDKILDATETLTNACGNCHVKFRDVPKPEDRCR